MQPGVKSDLVEEFGCTLGPVPRRDAATQQRHLDVFYCSESGEKQKVLEDDPDLTASQVVPIRWAQF